MDTTFMVIKPRIPALPWQVGKKKYKQGETARREILTGQWTSENAIPKDLSFRMGRLVTTCR